MKEVSKDYDKFIENKEESPNAKEDFDKLLEKISKPDSDKVDSEQD